MFNYLDLNYKEEFEAIRNQDIQILHWRGFDSKRKRCTLVMRYNGKAKEDREFNDENGNPLIFVYSKG